MADKNVETLVRAALERVLAQGLSPQPAKSDAQGPLADSKGGPAVAGGLCGAAEVLAARSAGVLRIPPGTIVTALARDAARDYGVRLVEEAAGEGAPGPRRIALAADHGGFRLKQELAGYLRKDLGYAVEDLGTHSEDPVDYPDYAARVAHAVAEGSAAFGIAVDGAGIGSAMTANKVRGVLAATCWNEASARNAREHNRATVLCLGARMMGVEEAKAICRAFLETPFGGGRHEKRVEKILEIERTSAQASSRREA